MHAAQKKIKPVRKIQYYKKKTLNCFKPSNKIIFIERPSKSIAKA